MATVKHAIFAFRPTPYYPALACYAYRGGGGGEDRISHLPDGLLSNIVGRLPVKDAARTTVLSSRWLRIWHSTPLFLDDDDLIPSREDDVDMDTIADAVSCILGSHPGPFRFVRLTCTCEHAASIDDGKLLRTWISAIADKGVDDLVLLNRRRPAHGNLPADVLRLSSLCRLDLAYWDFPTTDDLSRDARFPHLRELGLFETRIRAADLDRLIRFSVKLKKLAVIGSNNSPPSVLIRSYNLRCLLFWKAVTHKVHVLAAASLERLILWNPTAASPPTKLIIGHAPKLHTVGFLDPSSHVLELCYTLVQLPSPSPLPMAPSVINLALKFRIGVPQEVDMVALYLRCFPNVHILHVMFNEDDEPSVMPSFKVWQDIPCLLSTVQVVVLRNFQADDVQFQLFVFLWLTANVLKKVVLVLADALGTREAVVDMLKSVWANRAGSKPKIVLQSGGTKWSFHTASDLSVADPFRF
ncbi:hypothetical protein ACP70R_033442 [Stipagrostis hirtigluma subsp. patula]